MMTFSNEHNRLDILASFSLAGEKFEVTGNIQVAFLAFLTHAGNPETDF
jgi:hypothetical protein